MAVFLVITGVMALATILWLVRALTQKGSPPTPDQAQANLQILREEREALERDLSEGRLTELEAASSRRDLELRLIAEDAAIYADALPATMNSPPRNSSVNETTRAPRRASWVIGIGVPVALAGLYLTIGTPSAIDSAHQAGEEVVGLQQIQQMVARLESRLKENPSDAQGWYMLARSYAVLQRAPESIRAYSNAQRLDPMNPSLLADFADLLGFQNKSLEGDPFKMIEQALLLDPTHLKALSLAGTARFERGDFSGAIRDWSKALSLVQPESPEAQGLRGSIAEAESKAAVRAQR